MAEDISTLVLKVTSDGITQGTTSLKGLTKAAGDAEAATKKLGTTSAAASVASQSLTGTAQAMAAANQSLVTSTNAVTQATNAGAVASAQAAIQRKRDAETAKNSSVDYMLAQQQAIKMNQQITDSMNNVTKGHGSNAAAMRESMVLIHELSQGSYKRFGGSLMVLANQLDLIPRLMNSIGAASKAMQFAVLGGVAAIAIISFALIKGAIDLHSFNNELIISGNTMGLTNETLQETAKAVSSSTGNTVGAVRNTLEAMVHSGIYTKDTMSIAAETITNYARLTGTSAEEATQHFQGMKDGVEKFALANNATGRSVSADTIELIHDFELVGDSANAMKAYLTDLNSGIKKSDEHLNNIGKTLQWLADVAQKAGHAFMTMGQEASDGDKLQTLQTRLAKMQDGAKNSTFFSGGYVKGVAETQKQITDLQVKMTTDRAKAVADAEDQAKKRRSSQDRADFIQEETAMRQKAEKFEDMESRLRQKGASGGVEQSRIDAAVEDARVKYMKEHAVKGSDDSRALRDAQLALIKGDNEEKIALAKEFIQHSKELATKQGSDEQFQLEQRVEMYQVERDALTANYQAELKAIDDFAKQKHTKVEYANNLTKRQQLTNTFGREMRSVDKTETVDTDQVESRAIAAHKSAMDRITSEQNAANKSIQDQIEGEDRLLARTEGNASAGTAKKLEQNLATTAAIQNQVDLNQFLLDEATLHDNISESARQEAQATIDGLNKQIDGRKKLAKVEEEVIAAQKKNEADVRTTKAIDAQLAAAKRFEKGMVEAFGNIGKAVGGMTVAFDQMAKDRDTAQQKFNKASKEDLDSGAAQLQLDNDTTDAKLQGYATMADAAKGFFSANSKGYQVVNAVAQTVHLAQLARNAAEIVSGVAAGAAQMFAQSGWGGFAGVALMGAVMAGLGVAISGGGGGAGANAADVQKTQGTGTVFGDPSAKSDTVTKLLDELKTTSSLMLPLTQGMYNSLRNIEASLTGLANLVIRTTGVTEGTNLGIQTGTTKNSTATMVGAAIGSLLGPIGTVLGGFIGSLWGKTTQTIVDSGIQLAGKVADLQNGKGYNQYASVNTTSSSFFGLSKSTSNSVVTQGLNEELSSQFALVFKNLETTLKIAAKGLGKSSEDVGTAIENLVLDTQQVSLKGLSGADLEKAINNMISKTMDEIAQAAFPEMEAFRQVGEGYAQTVVRVASGIEQATVSLKQFGITAISYTDIASKTGDVAAQIIQQSILLKEAGTGVGQVMAAITDSAENLVATYQALIDARRTMQSTGLGSGLNVDTVNGAGDLKTLTSSLASYTKNYMSSAEQLQVQTDSVSAAFAAIGEKLPSSRLELRQWIEAAAKAGDQSTVGKLLALVDVYDKLATATGGFTAGGGAQATLDAITGMSDQFKQLGMTIPTSQVQLQSWINEMVKVGTPDQVIALLHAASAFDKLVSGTNKFSEAVDAVGQAFQALSSEVSKEKANVERQYAQQSAISTLKHYEALDAIKDDKDGAIAKAAQAKMEQQAMISSMAADVSARSVLNDKMIADTSNAISTITSVLNALKTAVVATSSISADDARKAALKTVQAGAVPGGIAANGDNITEAIKTLQKDNSSTFSTFAEFQASQAEANNALLSLQSSGETQLTDAQAQLEALNAIKTSLDAQSQSFSSALQTGVTDITAATAQATADAISAENDRFQKEQDALSAKHAEDIAKLDGQLALAQAQLDMLTNANTGIINVAAALNNFAGAVSVAIAAANATAQSAVTAAQSNYNSTGKLPSFAIGVDDVPEDMTANIHKGERIIPAADNAELMRRLKANDAESQDQSDTQSVSAKMDQLIQVVMAGDLGNVQKTNEMLRIIRTWDANGMPEVRPQS